MAWEEVINNMAMKWWLKICCELARLLIWLVKRSVHFEFEMFDQLSRCSLLSEYSNIVDAPSVYMRDEDPNP